MIGRATPPGHSNAKDNLEIDKIIKGGRRRRPFPAMKAVLGASLGGLTSEFGMGSGVAPPL